MSGYSDTDWNHLVTVTVYGRSRGYHSEQGSIPVYHLHPAMRMRNDVFQLIRLVVNKLNWDIKP